MSTCRCGTQLAEQAEWCPVCLRRPMDQDDLVAELHDTFRKSTWAPPEKLIAPSPPKRFSRWHPGPLSFGPRVKVPVTIVIVLFVLREMIAARIWTWFGHQDGYHIERGVISFWLFLVVVCSGLILWAIWKKSRVE